MSVAVFCMPERGHLQRLLPLVAGLTGRGIPTQVFTDERFRDPVERAGGRFVDLFASRPIAAADATSIPVPCRYVSFAAHYCESVAEELATFAPKLVIHDSFAVIAPLVAARLGLVAVNVCAGHNLEPQRTLAELRRDPRVSISESCLSAVEKLRTHHGMLDATPFSYITTLSSHLNLYCEPEPFLRPHERRAFEPVAFFGSLHLEDRAGTSENADPFGADSGSKVRLYASFGTVVWRYYATEAMAALTAIAEAVDNREDLAALISLGGRSTPESLRCLTGNKVRVADYVDQWSVLSRASVFITHQGLNSTHEAIYHRVPMISYPFFTDQPGLARRCEELGLAFPLADSVRGTVDAKTVRFALDRMEGVRDDLLARLAVAREWELETIAARPAILDRIESLMRSSV